MYVCIKEEEAGRRVGAASVCADSRLLISDLIATLEIKNNKGKEYKQIKIYTLYMKRVPLF